MRVETTLPPYRDRYEAARLLANELHHYRHRAETVVVGLPPGGVVTAAVVAEELALPLDVLALKEGDAGYRDMEREHVYRSDRPPVDLHHRCVIVVDDGQTSSAGMDAAIAAIKWQRPSRTVVAVPIAPPEMSDHLRPAVDELVTLAAPWPFEDVALWYEDFPEVEDDEIAAAIHRAQRRELVTVDDE